MKNSSGSGSCEKERLPRIPGGRGRGCSRVRSSGLSFVSVEEESVSREFPFSSAFYRYVHPLIENWMNVMGDGNCGFRVLSYFLYSNEHWWAEVRR